MRQAIEAPRVPLIEIVVSGALDAVARGRLDRLCDDAIALRPADLVVDFTGCTCLDAAGIGLLVEVHRRIWAAGGRLTLSGLSPRLHRNLQLARVDRVLNTATARPATNCGVASHGIAASGPRSRSRPAGTDLESRTEAEGAMSRADAPDRVRR